MTARNSLIGVFEEALNTVGIAVDSPVAPDTPILPPKGPRDLDIIFYGMMCFDPLEDGSGYRVLFPNGLDLPELMDIPVHAAGLWVRNRSANATAKWSGFAFRNDFFVGQKSQKHELTISGLAKTPLNSKNFERNVTNLQKCDPNFAVREEDRDTVMEMIVDRGTLSAHVVDNGTGMIVVKWTVKIQAGQNVRFSFGDADFVEVGADAGQIFLVNVSASTTEETTRHFQLFRKLSKESSKLLPFVPPATPPTGALKLIEPTFGYAPAQNTAPQAPAPKTKPPKKRNNNLPPLVGAIPQLLAIAETPEIVCSPVVSRLREATG